MNILRTPPAGFPGEDMSLQWGSEFIYETDYVRYGRTTGSDAITVVPDIAYRVCSEVDWGPEEKYVDSSAGKIGEELLDERQKQAIETAKEIAARRASHDPTLDNFVNLRKLALDNNDQIYICESEEGGRLQSSKPAAAVRDAHGLGIIDFATATLGYYGLFKFNARDIDEFLPPELAGVANSYMTIDEPRVVVGPNGEYDYQIAKLMLFRVESDLDYPLDQLDRTVRIVTVEEDGSETINIYDPDKD